MATHTNESANLIPLKECHIQRMSNREYLPAGKTPTTPITPPSRLYLLSFHTELFKRQVLPYTVHLTEPPWQSIMRITDSSLTAVQGCSIPYNTSFTWQAQRYINRNQHSLVMLVQAIHNIHKWVVLPYLVCDLRPAPNEVKSIVLWNQLHSLNVLCATVQTIRIIIKR